MFGPDNCLTRQGEMAADLRDLEPVGGETSEHVLSCR